MNLALKDPFRFYFPVGVMFSLWGTLLWVLFFFQKVAYPGLNHADLMIMGFYTHIALGFLMTAIPRFTNTPTAHLFEWMVGVFLVALSVFGFACHNSNLVHQVFLLEIIFLVLFFLRRFFRRKSNPPPPFAFLFVGLVCALLGGISLVYQQWSSVGFAYQYKSLINFGWTMAPMLGLGSVLVPRILGFNQSAIQPLTTNQRNFVSRPHFILSFVALFFLVSQLGMAIWPQAVIYLYLRQLIITGLLLGVWKIYRWPVSPGYLVKGLWLSGWFMFVGSWMSVFDTVHSVHLNHLYFIGAIGLMIACIATRVSVAHGNYPQTDETESKVLLTTILILVLAAFTRVVAIYTQSYFLHLAIAAGLWIVAFGLWLFKYAPKIVKSRK